MQSVGSRRRRYAARRVLVLDTATGSEAETSIRVSAGSASASSPIMRCWPEGGFCATTLFYKRIAA
ncbi:MAG: hypothetical protein U5L46_12120 [Agrobacterium sp.]|nr:hypothetical protein [Agrobacterium sp.]